MLIDDGNPVWQHNPGEWTTILLLSFREKFWWTIVSLRLMPTGRDANLEIQRAVMVATLIEGLTEDFNHTVADELFACAHKTSSALPFP